MSTTYTDTTAPAEIRRLWEQGQVDNNPWEGYDQLHPWRGDDDSTDSWDSGQTMENNKNYDQTQDTRSDTSWHTCPTMGSKESEASDDPHISNNTGYSADDEAYEERANIATPWDIPTRQEHTELDHVLTYVVRKQLPDYTAIRMLGQCKPTNDLTRLCQHLCMDGAAQRLSGEIQTFDFDHADLEELFHSLDWHLCSKSVINSFYESCGFTEPYPPLHEQGTKIFRSLSREWTRRCE